MTQERMKLIAFNVARTLVLTYNAEELKNMSREQLVGLCDRSVVIRAAKLCQINTIIDGEAYNTIIQDFQFMSTLDTQVKSLINNRKIY